MKKQILALRAKGKSYREIQKILGCSRSTISYHCGEGQKQKKNDRQNQSRAERLAMVAAIKSAPCIDCGNIFPPECMDFDHVGETKNNRVSQLAWNGSWQAVVGEIAKCELVCANCHRIRTRKRGRAGWVGQNGEVAR